MRWDEIHVIWRDDISHWCARTLVGDYGISRRRDTAIAIANDAYVTTGRYKKIIVHEQDDHVYFTITKVKGLKPSRQFFQDSVS